MPKTMDEILRENSVKALKQGLHRFTDDSNLGEYVGQVLGVSYVTGLKRVQHPELLTIQNLRDLKLTDNEIVRIVRGRCLEV